MRHKLNQRFRQASVLFVRYLFLFACLMFLQTFGCSKQELGEAKRPAAKYPRVGR